MGKLLGSLEAMKGRLDADNEEEDEDGEVETAMLAVMEAEQEINDGTDDLGEMDDLVEESDAAIERLEGIVSSIEQFGICKAQMMAADPQGELVAAGLVVAYEELEDAPVKDENAESAVEGIGSKIKEIWKQLVAFFKSLAQKLKVWFDTVMNGFKSYENAIVAMVKRFKDAEIDETRFKEINVNAFSKADFDKIVNACSGKDLETDVTPVINTLKATFDKGISGDSNAAIDKANSTLNGLYVKLGAKYSSTLGFTIKASGDTVAVERSQSKLKRKKESLTKLGWTTSSAESALKDAARLVIGIKVMDKAILVTTKGLNMASDIVNKQLSTLNGMSAEEVRTANKAVGALRSTLTVSRTVLQMTLIAAQSAASSALSVGKAVLSAKPKKK